MILFRSSQMEIQAIDSIPHKPSVFPNLITDFQRLLSLFKPTFFGNYYLATIKVPRLQKLHKNSNMSN